MKKYSKDEEATPQFTRFHVRVKDEQTLRDFHEVSSFLHYFYVKRYGRPKKRHDYDRWVGLDDDNIIVNQIMHLYVEHENTKPENFIVKVEPELLALPHINFVIIVPTEEDRQEILGFSKYISEWKAKCRGKGTKKHHSSVYKYVTTDDWDLEYILSDLKLLHHLPLFEGRIIVSPELYEHA